MPGSNHAFFISGCSGSAYRIRYSRNYPSTCFSKWSYRCKKCNWPNSPHWIRHVTQVVALEGEYVQSFPPPAIGSYLAKFTAHMAIDNNWNGTGGFTYENHDVNDVPVKKQ
jgi:hypothetical protein